MRTHNIFSIRVFNQQGATLIVSLVILAVVTVLGLASIRSSNLELRMAASARDRAIAFQRAEAALSTVEQSIAQSPFEVTSFMPTCTGNRCFNPDCTNGLCFSGDLEGAVQRSDCRLAGRDGAVSRAKEHWRISTHWETENRLPTVPIDTGRRNPPAEENEDPTPIIAEVPYMIEFLCFVPRSSDAIDDENSTNSGVPLYRITARAEGDAKRASVMLQSVVRAGNR